MALVIGTNCGFVTSAPSNDPSGATALIMDTRARALKDTAPAKAVKVTEIGWWCDNATQEANFDVGIYSHDAGNDRPNALIGSSKNNAKGTSSGWKKITSLDITITAWTVYWIGVQLDDTATQTNLDFDQDGSSGTAYKSSQTALPDSWGSSDGSDATSTMAIYALVEVSNQSGFFSLF